MRAVAIRDMLGRAIRDRLRILVSILKLALELLLPQSLYRRVNAWNKNQLLLRARSPFQSVLTRNLVLRNIHQKSSRVFVVGAGPSLKHLNTELLKNEIIIGINAAYLNPGILKAQRKYWILIDYFFMEMTPDIVETLRAIETAVGDATYLFPVQAIPVCSKYCLFEERKVYYFLLKGFDDVAITDDRLDLTAVLPQPHGSTETGLICAAYFGVKQVYMIGVDSDWFAFRCSTSRHFYAEEENPHSIDRKILNWIDFSQMESKLHYGYLLYRNYRLLRDALRARGVAVYNASGGGLLDVFPWVDYDSLFK